MTDEEREALKNAPPPKVPWTAKLLVLTVYALSLLVVGFAIASTAADINDGWHDLGDLYSTIAWAIAVWTIIMGMFSIGVVCAYHAFRGDYLERPKDPKWYF